MSTLPGEVMQRNLFLLFAAVLGFVFSGAAVIDPDLGWQLFGGAYLSTHRALPQDDPINYLNAAWFNYHWLAQIVLYQTFTQAGLVGIQLLYGVTISLLLTLLADTIWLANRGRSLLVSLVSFLWAVSLLSQVISHRPQTFGLLGVTVALRLLVHRNVTTPGILLLAATTGILANMHVFWFFIPVLWALFEVSRAILHRRQLARALGIGALLLLCGAASPYGTSSFSLLREYATTPIAFRETIGEFGTGVRDARNATLILLPFLPLLFRLRTGWLRGLRPEVFATVLSAALTVMSIKFIAVLALFASPLLAKDLRHILHSLLPGLATRGEPVARKLTSVLLALSATAAIAFFPTWPHRSFTRELPRGDVIEICGALAQHLGDTPHPHPIRVATRFNTGGWCRWGAYLASPQLDLRVSVDGRTQFVPPERYTDANTLFEVRDSWGDVLTRWDPDFILTEQEDKLTTTLTNEIGWRVLVRQGKYTLFAPSDDPLLSRHGEALR